MKAALYARVSTKDKEQDPERQVDKLRQLCKAMDWEVSYIIKEEESGRKEREGIKRILELARIREIDVVIVWKFDRLTREGAYAAIEYIKKLDEYGVLFKSLTEPFLDTTGSFGKEVLIPLFAWMAKQESEKISENVTSGIEKKKKDGKYYQGKPSYNLTEEQIFRIIEIRFKRPKGGKLKALRRVIAQFHKETGIRVSLAHVHKICDNPQNYIRTEELLKKLEKLKVYKGSYEQSKEK